mmetsp:Transcript_22652/g.55490  ORF Transcript_22652/g.55490 Transcript_22652/m.55490 type:complete len:141 (-) Transcript_22652:59-481(-)
MQHAVLLDCMKAFVSSLLAGFEVTVVPDVGTDISARLSIDDELTVLTLDVQTIVRQLPLERIQCAGPSLELAAIACPQVKRLDERCASMILADDDIGGWGHCLNLRFETPRARKFFVSSMKVLLVGADPPVLQKEKIHAA